MRWLMVPAILLCAASPAFPAKPLSVYFVDVEGGQATLIVTPSGQSMLIDTGWRGFEGRDAGRIALAAKKAGVKQIDYVLVTHYHRDHVGGAPALASRMKIGTYIDHGPDREKSKVTTEDFNDYERLLPRAKHMVVKPGDTIPLKGVGVEVLSADGAVIGAPLAGAGQTNPACSGIQRREDDPTENARSVGILLTFGKFRMLDLGDLTWNKELDLMCPLNRVGTVGVYVVSHHGWNQSGSPALVDGLHPRVAIMDNGARKGGSPETWQVVKDAPGLEDLWQLHYAVEGGKDHNVPDSLIANVDEHCQGDFLKLTATGDGGFSVLNGRNRYRKDYPAK